MPSKLELHMKTVASCHVVVVHYSSLTWVTDSTVASHCVEMKRTLVDSRYVSINAQSINTSSQCNVRSKVVLRFRWINNPFCFVLVYWNK